MCYFQGQTRSENHQIRAELILTIPKKKTHDLTKSPKVYESRNLKQAPSIAAKSSQVQVDVVLLMDACLTPQTYLVILLLCKFLFIPGGNGPDMHG